MNALESVSAACPYCGEVVEWVVDCTLPMQRYVEDCPVCCQPIDITVQAQDEGRLPSLTLHRQDEA